jgi:hypothetical protein
MAENMDGQQRANTQPRQAAPQYLSYLLRLWRSGSSEQWRGSLQSTANGETQVFADVTALLAFLVTQLAEESDDSALAHLAAWLQAHRQRFVQEQDRKGESL